MHKIPSLRFPFRSCLFAVVSGLWLSLAAPVASAIGTVTFGQMLVVEYYNTFLGHYFMTIDAGERADIDAGKAGPGWVRTGWYFTALPPGASDVGFGFAATANVSRFYGTPGLGPNSHFFTADAAEAAGLNRPGTGWTLERIEFQIPVPDAAGQCASGLVPVYRLYNMRWMFNDSNHRYVTSQAERARMQAMGWVDEGVRFCAYSADQLAIKSFSLDAFDLPAKVRPSADCEDEALNVGPCIAVNNLRTPNQVLALPTTFTRLEDAVIPRFAERGGVSSTTAYVPDNTVAPLEAAQDVFVQQSAPPQQPEVGIHVDTRNRGASTLSSVNPLYQLRTAKGPQLRDDRFFPFAAYESDVELQVWLELTVRQVNVRAPGGAAYGHPTLEFIDTRSGHHLYFTILTYGTVPQGDYLAFDTGTGKVIVGTTFGPHASYGRSLGAAALSTPSGFSMPFVESPANHGQFEFRMMREDFRKAVANGRTLDPALSSDPADYLLDNFHFNNEVYLDGEIGLTHQGYRVRLLRAGAGQVPFGL